MDIAAVGESSALLLEATDDWSGVTAMRVGLDRQLNEATWESYQTSRTLWFDGPAPSQSAVYVQFRDGVGNESPVLCASRGGAVCHAFHLPLVRR